MKSITNIILIFSFLTVQFIFSQEDAPAPADDVNWISNITYTIDGQTLSKGVGYFNTLGKGTQTQSWDVLTGKVWANQTLYDYRGRAAFQSLSAPINSTGYFGLDSQFILDADGNAYDADDFSVSTYGLDPSSVSSSSKLGAYYWNNSTETYLDNTEYPFTLVEYSTLNTGATKKVIGGNKINGEWLQAYNFDMKSGNELSTNRAFGLDQTQYDGMQISKTVVRDAHGIETVVFVDNDGNVLAAARSGNEESNNTNSETNTVIIGSAGWVDIHVAQGCSNDVTFASVGNGNNNGNTGGNNGNTNGGEEGTTNVLTLNRIASYESKTENQSKSSQEVASDLQTILNREFVDDTTLPIGIYYRVYDLITEEVIMTVPADTYQLPHGFYRVEPRFGILINLPLLGDYHLSYSISERPELFNFENLTYKVMHCQNYYDYSLNYYDKSGRLLKSTQPNGINMKTDFSYNSLGQLLETTSPDEGTAQFVYRKDGQIRFSQNTKQLANDEFSYTNYDRLGRPVESGVYRSDDIPFYLATSQNATQNTSSTLVSEVIVPVHVQNMNISVDVYGTEYAKQNVSGNWNGGFASQQTIQEDGIVEFKAGDLSGNIESTEGYEVIVGFSVPEDAADADYTDIKFGISLYVPDPSSGGTFLDPQIRIYQNGDYKRHNGQILTFGTFDETDVFSVKRENGIVGYYQNDVALPILTLVGENTYTQPLVMDASFKKGLNAINSLLLYRTQEDTSNTTDIYDLVNVQDGLNDTNCFEQHFTLYDMPDPELSVLLDKCGIPSRVYEQTFLSGNVSRTQTKKPQTTTSWYSYDIYGRVQWIIQEVDGLQCLKTLDYTYDPITGQVVEVDYQRHMKAERFVHKYAYNVGGQLLKTYTSLDGLDFTEQAKYEYNEGGQLIRTVIAENLQGIDYVYNLSGQLKAINHPSLNPSNDPGHDGNNGVIADVFGMTLNYYDGDFTRTNTPTPIETSGFSSTQDQFNGNIKGVKWQTESGQPSTYAYSYNKNNWLTAAQFTNPNVSNSDDYKVNNISYDANGNIQTLKRNGFSDTEGGTNAMDDFTYDYTLGKNQLDHITDTNDNGDEHRYNDLKSQQPTNYEYNAIGQLVINKQDNVLYEYNASGLVTQISAFATTNTDTYHTLFEQYFEDLFGLRGGGSWDITTGFMRIVNANQLDQVDTVSDSFSNLLLDVEDPNTIALPLYCTDFDNANDPYGSRVQFNFYENAEAAPNPFTIQSTLQTIEGAYHKLDFDVMLLQEQIENDTNLSTIISTAISAGATVSLTQDDGTVIQTFTIDSQTAASYCNRIVEHISFEFLSTGNEVHLTIDVANNGETTGLLPFSEGGAYTKLHQSVEIDNFQLQVANAPKIAFYYNDRGQRVRKEAYQTGTTYRDVTYYVRDATGSAMAIYNKPPGKPSSEASIPKEHPIYGASRVGVHYKDGSKFGTTAYQLSDHLGNVRAVVLKSGTNALSLTSKTDYYPFGMPMPNRNIEGSYRNGYQGEFAEKDPETGMEAFELRLWDSRIGRWLTIDPYKQYSSPYLGMGNSPNNGVEIDGGVFVLTGLTGDQKKLWNAFKAKIRSSKFGRMIFDTVENSPHEVNVVWQYGTRTGKIKGDFFFADDEDGQMPDDGTYLSFSDRLSVYEENALIQEFMRGNKWGDHPIVVVVGHEIYHAYQFITDSEKQGVGRELDAVKFQNYLYRSFGGTGELRNGYLKDHAFYEVEGQLDMPYNFMNMMFDFETIIIPQRLEQIKTQIIKIPGPKRIKSPRYF